MKKAVLWITALLVILVTACFWWFLSGKQFFPLGEGGGLLFEKQFQTSSYIFYCGVYPKTESNCRVYVSDLDGTGRRSLDITLDYGSQITGFILSPDKKKVLIIREKEVTLIDGNTLTQKRLAEAEIGTEFGVYTSFPSFVPVARWLDSSRVELGVFAAGSEKGYSYIDEQGKSIAVSDARPIQYKIVVIE